MRENTNLHYATKLYKLRRVANIKQPELAKQLGISQQAYSKLERGETHFNDEVIDTICLYFKIPLSEFLQTNDGIHCVNSPNSGNNNNTHHSPYNEVASELLPAFLEELKSIRTERQFYLQQIERLIEMVMREE
jgi:transcriptional regulator with XRE-family HTH domain